MDRWKGKVAIVTGASAGIGAAIAGKLVGSGVKVVGLARRKEKIEELAKSLQNQPGELHGVRADITKEEDILTAFKWAKNNLGPIHIVINNAGVGRIASLIEGKTGLWREVFDTNVIGLCMVTREAVKDMRENKVDGHIVHINSTLGHKIPPQMGFNVYPATKHAITALTETLRQELDAIGSKIKISSVSPDIVKTDIRSTSYRASGIETAPPVRETSVSARPMLQTEDVADAVICVLATPPNVEIAELMVHAI